MKTYPVVSYLNSDLVKQVGSELILKSSLLDAKGATEVTNYATLVALEAAATAGSLIVGELYTATNMPNKLYIAKTASTFYEVSNISSYRAVTGNTTLNAATDFYLEVDATSGNKTVNVPSAITNAGKAFMVKKTDASANTVAITCFVAGQMIDGVEYHYLRAQYDGVMIYSDGAHWKVITKKSAVVNDGSATALYLRWNDTNKVYEPRTLAQMKTDFGITPFAEYIATLTQDTITSTSGVLVEGKTYVIASLVAGDDFTNVGYTAPNTPFVATGTTPTTWTNSTSVLNVTDSNPVATVVKNTLSGPIVWARTGVGVYTGTLTGAFTAAGTLTYKINDAIVDGSNDTFKIVRTNDNVITINTYTDSYSTAADGVLASTPIKIEVHTV